MSTIPPEFLADFKQIYKASKANKLVIFVGAGVSMNAGIPSWYELIKQFEKELPENKNETDFLKIAQLYKLSRKHKEYIERIREILKYERVTYNELHEAIFKLNPCHIVTTNYDDLLEQCAAANNYFYYPIVKDEDLPYATVENFIIKMHGDLLVGNIVLSEEEYLNYELNFPLTENYVKSLFSTKLILFVGFSFNDYNLKIITNKVKNILGKHFQPMYLLSDNTPDYLQARYFEDRGVKLLDISNKDVREVLNNYSNSTKDVNLTDPKGIQLYKTLDYLSNFNPIDFEITDKNFFDQLVLKYEATFPELNFVGSDAIVQLFEKNSDLVIDTYRSPFTLGINNVKIRPFLKRIYNVIENGHLIKLNKSTCKKVLSIFKRNLIFSITYIDINENKYGKREVINLSPFFENTTETIDLFYTLDFVNLKNGIDKLQNPTVKEVTINDLELPYLLYKLGKNLEAYTYYKNIANRFWKQKKYILYFISMYNMKKMYGLIHRDFTIDNKTKKEILDEIESIKLDYILRRLPIYNAKTEEILRSILANSFTLKKSIPIADLKKSSQESKKLNESENGFSWNNNPIILLSEIVNIYTFCNSNFIISEHFSEIIKIYQNAGEAFLIHHSIKANEEKGIRETYLDQFNVQIISIYSEPKDLIRCLNEYDIDKLLLNNAAKEYLRPTLFNALNGINKKIVGTFVSNQPVISSVYSQTQNILILLASSNLENDEIIEIYKKISETRNLEYWQLINGLEFFTYSTLNFINDISILETILINIFSEGLKPSYRRYSTIIENIFTRIYQIDNSYKINSPVILNELFSDNTLDDTYETEFVFILKSLLPNDKTNELISGLLNKLKVKMDISLFNYFISYEIETNEELEKKFIEESVGYFTTRTIKYSSTDEWNLLNLSKVRKKYKDSEPVEKVIELSKQQPFLAFLINPAEFDYKNTQFRLSWLSYTDKATITDLIKSTNLKIYLKNNIDKLKNDKRLMELLLDEL